MGTPGKEPKNRLTIGRITFSAGAVEELRDEFASKGKISSEQAAVVTYVLEEEGPQVAIRKLASFLQQLPQ